MSVSQKPDFTFVDDEDLHQVLENYYSQREKAYAATSYLGAIVACGSVVEGLLTWALSKRADAARSSKRACKDKTGQARPIEEWNLANLISVAVELGLIGDTASDASWAVKDFRNLIHPYNLLARSARPDQALAMSALAAVSEIVRSLRGRVPDER